MEDTPSINGWKPPVVYDLANDAYRIATQEDINSMQIMLQLYGQFFGDTKRAVERIESERPRTSR